MARTKKRLRRVFFWVVTGASLVVFSGVLLAFPHPFPQRQVQGVTFAIPQVEAFSMEWQEVYDAILHDLGVRHLRLSAYWDAVEPEDDRYDWAALDYQMDEAAAAGARVILSIGRKLPRWPECRVPDWAQKLPEVEQQEEVLEMLAVVVERYRDHEALRMWQLENEPFLAFGICPPSDAAFLAQEEAVVRSLDSAHPILITDSGELNFWWVASGYGDVMGTTMYRTVISEVTGRRFFYDYIFPSWAYRLKARYIELLRGKSVLISELQGEPWGTKPIAEMTRAERDYSFSPKRMRQLHRFAERTQLPEAYWWGVEFWYWEKAVNGDPVFWEMAREYFGS